MNDEMVWYSKELGLVNWWKSLKANANLMHKLQKQFAKRLPGATLCDSLLLQWFTSYSMCNNHATQHTQLNSLYMRYISSAVGVPIQQLCKPDKLLLWPLFLCHKCYQQYGITSYKGPCLISYTISIKDRFYREKLLRFY